MTDVTDAMPDMQSMPEINGRLWASRQARWAAVDDGSAWFGIAGGGGAINLRVVASLIPAYNARYGIDEQAWRIYANSCGGREMLDVGPYDTCEAATAVIRAMVARAEDGAVG